LGAQVWLAENLDFGARVPSAQEQIDDGLSEKYCYADDPSKCVSSGGLYQWAEAMSLPSGCGGLPPGSAGCEVGIPHRGICPAGWHLPSRAEWTTLDSAVDAMNSAPTNNEGYSLKSTSGWSGVATNGTDAYGFTGLPAGFRSLDATSEQGSGGYYWSASEGGASVVWCRFLGSAYPYLYEGTYDKTSAGMSVRCILD
jgi:uncharacterized protein (TIGR02145 family)